MSHSAPTMLIPGFNCWVSGALRVKPVFRRVINILLCILSRLRVSFTGYFASGCSRFLAFSGACYFLASSLGRAPHCNIAPPLGCLGICSRFLRKLNAPGPEHRALRKRSLHSQQFEPFVLKPLPRLSQQSHCNHSAPSYL